MTWGAELTVYNVVVVCWIGFRSTMYVFTNDGEVCHGPGWDFTACLLRDLVIVCPRRRPNVESPLFAKTKQRLQTKLFPPTSRL